VTGDQRLSGLEWEIMNVVWELGGRPSVRDVLECAYPDGEKAYTTVQTVMNHLVDKGFLAKERSGLANLYRPLRRRPDTVRKETARFVDRVFGGSFPALADHLIRSRRLSDDERAELRRLLDEHDDGSPSGRGPRR